MRKIEFETSKGKFLVVDMTDIDYDILSVKGNRLQRISYLSEITEKQASEIVVKNEFTPTYKEELFTRLKSKGIHLYESSSDDCNNHFCDNGKIDIGYGEFNNCSICEDILDNTFYNPYIFKVL